MKKYILLFILFPFIISCSSDDNTDTPNIEKEYVTSKDIIGTWDHIEMKGDNAIRYNLSFNPNGTSAIYTIYYNDNIIRQRRFNYTIIGYKMKLEGGAIAGDSPLSETEIYKSNGKLYYNNMPFSYKNE